MADFSDSFQLLLLLKAMQTPYFSAPILHSKKSRTPDCVTATCVAKTSNGVQESGEVRNWENNWGGYIWKVCIQSYSIWVMTLCRVKFAVNTETGDRVAIKILDKQKIIRQGMAEQIKKEVVSDFF